MINLLFVLSIVILQQVKCSIFPKNSTIDNSDWKDVDGNFIHAHGGQIVEYDDIYYWIGATIKLPPSYLSEGINCYSSVDLVNWKFVNEIFHNTSIVVTNSNNSNVGPPWRIERPKVVYNSNNNNFVMWFHLDTSSFALKSVGVSTSDTICGNYTWVDSFEPDGLASYDMGLFDDSNYNSSNDNGNAYLVRSVENKFAGVSQLNYSNDYLNTTENGIISQGPQMEGVTIFKLNTYYLFGSHLTGWKPNAAILCTTNNTISLINAQWKNCANPSNSSTTYNSQSTFVTRLYDSQENKFVFLSMADIWNAPNVSTATYLWLPFVFSDNSKESYPSLPYYDKWVIDDFQVAVP